MNKYCVDHLRLVDQDHFLALCGIMVNVLVAWTASSSGSLWSICTRPSYLLQSLEIRYLEKINREGTAGGTKRYNKSIVRVCRRID